MFITIFLILTDMYLRTNVPFQYTISGDREQVFLLYYKDFFEQICSDVQFISPPEEVGEFLLHLLNSFSYACPPKISPLRARCCGIRQGFEQARTLAHYTRIWLLGFVPYSHSIAIFFCRVVAWKATFLCPYAPIRLWSKANSASLISYTL